MQHLDLLDEEAAALIKELVDITLDRYPFSARIRTLPAIPNKVRPEPVREPLPPKVYAAPPAAAPRLSDFFWRCGTVHRFTVV